MPERVLCYLSPLSQKAIPNSCLLLQISIINIQLFNPRHFIEQAYQRGLTKKLRLMITALAAFFKTLQTTSILAISIWTLSSFKKKGHRLLCNCQNIYISARAKCTQCKASFWLTAIAMVFWVLLSAMQRARNIVIA